MSNYLPLTGGTLIGTLKGTSMYLTTLNTFNIELSGSSSHGGYIDFHYGKSSEDYTSRIIEYTSGELYIDIASAGKSYKIIHAGNISEYI